MKIKLVLLGAVLTTLGAFAEMLPFISTHPQSLVVAPGSNATFTVVSTNATAYQWRFNGTNIAWGTTASLVLTNAQTNNNGYYLVIAKNATGWTPSQLGYLSVVWSNGILPFFNTNSAQVLYRWGLCGQLLLHTTPVTNGTAQLVAGPALEEMKPVGATRTVRNGYYGSAILTRLVASVAPGQPTYYRVDVTYSPPCGGPVVTQPSRTVVLIAGGDSVSVPQPTSLTFPDYLEWPDYAGLYSPTSRVGVVGEVMTLSGSYYAGSAYSLPLNWRKDGIRIPGATNSIFTTALLTLTNLTEADCGVYDLVGPGADGITQNKVLLSVQARHGDGFLKPPRVMEGHFYCDLKGAPTRRYTILSSTNLLDWTSNTTVEVGAAANTATVWTGTLGEPRRFIRARLLPIPIYPWQ